MDNSQNSVSRKYDDRINLNASNIIEGLLAAINDSEEQKELLSYTKQFHN